MESRQRITLILKHGVKIDIRAKRWADAWKACLMVGRFLKKAERTARHMERVRELSSQCMKEWEEISLILVGLEASAEPFDQEKAAASSQPSEGAAACSEDK